MKEMGRVYWTHGVGALSIAVAMIFVPIFLLESGYSFQTVLLFLLGQHLLATLLQFPVGKLFAKISSHHLMALGGLWQIVFFGLLVTLDEFGWPLWLLATVWALYRTAYFPAFHYVFGAARAHENAGMQVAGLQSIIMVATTLAPAIGGIVATAFDITYTYMAAAVLLLIATLPMLSPNTGPPTVKLRLGKAELKKMRSDTMANVFLGMVIGAEKAIWPILVFVLVSSYAGVGILSSVVAIASIGVTMFVGKHEGVKGEHRYIKQGMLATAITSVIRTLVQNALHVFVANLFAGIGRSLYTTPFMNRYYTNGDGPHRLGYVVIQETAFSIGVSIYFALLLLLSMFVSMQLVLIIGVASAAFTVLGLRFMR
jgi:hypothetical protein